MKSGQFSRVFKYANLVIPSTAWTPILAPIDCDYAVLYNSAGGWFGYGAQTVILRSDQNDDSTDKPLAPGMQEAFSSPHSRWSGTGPRFEAGETIWWAKANAGTADVVLTCVL